MGRKSRQTERVPWLWSRWEEGRDDLSSPCSPGLDYNHYLVSLRKLSLLTDLEMVLVYGGGSSELGLELDLLSLGI